MQQSQRQAKLMQRILDTVQEGIATLDAQHRVLNANPVARQFLNLLAEKDAAGAILSLGDRPLIELLRPRADGLPHELKLARPPGRTFECQVNEARQEVGEREHTILIRDVTDQRKIEDRMERQERLAAVGQLAAGIAHDFNNIMAAIILHSEMLLTEPGLSAKGLTRQGTILEQARRAASLTQQVLDFSRQAIMETKPLDLLAFMLETMKLLQRTLPESIRVRLDFEKGPYFLRGDPTRVQQVLMNLALNARDAMPEGGQLRFEMSHLFLDAQSRPPFGGMELGNWLIVEVTDTGTGIPPDVLPHIFEPFFTTKPQGRGTGLGLSQVFGIVKQHGGYIDVSSRVGHGTSFVIYLPALEVVAEQGSVKEVEAPRGQGEGVLVVEDNEATRQAICDILASLNYQVLQARNGEEALAAFEGQSDAIDLVISDLVMPEMGGRALHGALKQKRPDLKLILMTGYPLGGETRELLQEQAVVWVQKPIGTQKLAEIVRRTLDAT
jgi:signal transduction histidine kinase/CheY-like chemotaxis protein